MTVPAGRYSKAVAIYLNRSESIVECVPLTRVKSDVPFSFHRSKAIAIELDFLSYDAWGMASKVSSSCRSLISEVLLWPPQQPNDCHKLQPQHLCWSRSFLLSLVYPFVGIRELFLDRRVSAIQGSRFLCLEQCLRCDRRNIDAGKLQALGKPTCCD